MNYEFFNSKNIEEEIYKFFTKDFYFHLATNIRKKNFEFETNPISTCRNLKSVKIKKIIKYYFNEDDNCFDLGNHLNNRYSLNQNIIDFFNKVCKNSFSKYEIDCKLIVKQNQDLCYKISVSCSSLKSSDSFGSLNSNISSDLNDSKESSDFKESFKLNESFNFFVIPEETIVKWENYMNGEEFRI